MMLPVNRAEMTALGWDRPDFILVSGDAYIDHPSFGVAIISRALEANGYKVAILPQPDWRKSEPFEQFGEPRLGFLVTSGNIDSMVNHYSVSRKRRDKDQYTDNGEANRRPDRAVIVYSQCVRKAYPNVPIILGGIEASLRRLAHYDYWDDKVRKSILIDAGADLIAYGMAENTIIEIADALDGGLPIETITYVRGTAWKSKDSEALPKDAVVLPTFFDIRNDKLKYVKSYQLQMANQDAIWGKTMIEQQDSWYVVVNPFPLPLSRREMDRVYGYPYTRQAHPMYKNIPAFDEVRFSLISNRGCFGSCSFCALTTHQGRTISSRSNDSLLKEAEIITKQPDFKGYIHDVGGPTANFHRPSCDKQTDHGMCKHRECLHPEPCERLIVDHSEYVSLLKKLRQIPKVKKVFIRSGIRYDYLLYDKDDAFFDELVEHHISGQLKVAPEHVSDKVLDAMGKPRKKTYEAFVAKYEMKNRKFKKDQFLVPYLMSSHPGSDLTEAIELAVYLKKINFVPKQVQDFYPTPATVSTCMYYTGIDPRTDKPIYVAKKSKEKAMQRALMQFNYPQNYDLVKEALVLAKRLDLIGDKPGCLIRSTRPKAATTHKR